MPASPEVTSAYATDLPAAVHAATALAVPYSRSSGWAAMQSARVQSSGKGSRESVTAAVCPDGQGVTGRWPLRIGVGWLERGLWALPAGSADQRCTALTAGRPR